MVKKILGKCTVFLLAFTMLFPLTVIPVYAEEDPLAIDAVSAVLMEASSGKIFYEKNADAPLPPASVTKIMTLLLVMEAVDGGKVSMSDTVTVSEHAASMGGSQVYLKVGETMTLEDMVKSVVIASANDAAVALAEHIAGSEEAFVKRMNERAEELGMSSTNFENTNGLDDTADNHLTSAKDIAIMSRELLKHEKILEYSSTWMDSIRDGAFGLTNTNRLVRFYSGANGLKTGSTSKAKFCISATAKRDGMQLIAVIMGSPSGDIRNAQAKKLLDYGFANYGVYASPQIELENIRVYGGVDSYLPLKCLDFSSVLPKENIKNVTYEISLPEYISAPVKEGEPVGQIIYKNGEDEIGRTDISPLRGTERIGFFGLLGRLFQAALLMKK